jgi:glucose/mannose-6-phosphate isomerase
VLSLDEIRSVDRDGLWEAYTKWPDAARRALSQPIRLPKLRGFQSVVLVGIGGSGAACDIVADWMSARSELPVLVVKDYGLPRFVDDKSLVVLVSLSGDTKEVLKVLQEAVRRKCSLVAVSSGGALQRMSKKLGVPHNRVERMLVPRASLPGMVYVTLRILRDLRLINDEGELESSVAALEETLAAASPRLEFRRNPAKKLAKSLLNRRAVVYSAENTFSVAHHFKASMNENAKVPVLVDSYPELFHNEVETWSKGWNRSAVILRRRGELEEVRKRIQKLENLMDDAGADYQEVWGKGGLLGDLVSWALYLDLVSVFLAVLMKRRPILTPLLDTIRSL